MSGSGDRPRRRLVSHTIPRHVPGMSPGATRWNVLVLLSYLFAFVLLLEPVNVTPCFENHPG